jgi:short-subunit dehydrogenase
MNALVNEITVRWDGIDILINNAGIAYRSVIEQMNEHEELHQLKTNYLGPMALIRLILPTMREKGFGHIINISSVSGVMAMPTMGSYSASKHALEAATEALWYEMKPFGIQVSLVQPGFVHSDSYKNVYLSEKAKFTEKLGGPYADVYQFITPFIEKLMNLSPTTPEKIANKVLSICIHHNPKLWESATWDAVMFTVLKKILPRYLFHRIMFRFLPKSKAWGGNFKNQKAS